MTPATDIRRRSITLIKQYLQSSNTPLPFCPYTSAFQLAIDNAEVNEISLNYLTSSLEKSE